MSFFFEKNKTGSTPYVLVDGSRGYILMEGESFHENVIEFYREVNNWLKTHLKTDFKQLTFDCKFEYFNSSTAKILLNMFTEMDKHTTQENKIVVNWFAINDDDIIIECGNDYQEDMDNLTFNVIIG
jgi:hypothetical protein